MRERTREEAEWRERALRRPRVRSIWRGALKDSVGLLSAECWDRLEALEVGQVPFGPPPLPETRGLHCVLAAFSFGACHTFLHFYLNSKYLLHGYG